MYKGIDVSHNNGFVDWQKAKSSGIEFAVIRAGYGQLEDRRFDENMRGAAAAGLPIGVYYFSYALNEVKAAEEAAHCCGLIKKFGVDLPVFFDFEYASEEFGVKKGVAYTAALRTNIHKAFCERVRAGGYTPGIYTNADYITSRLNWQELRNYKFWLAQWPLGADRAIKFEEVGASTVNTGFGRPVIWQIGKGKIPGLLNDTDINYGYMELPDKTVSSPVATLKAGDKVKVINTVKTGVITRGKIYGGGMFVVYHSVYDVISVSGKRVVIGLGKSITAAVNADDLEKI